MTQSKIAIACFKALALSVLAFSAQAAELVTNGSFESTTNGAGQLGYNTDATGWTSAAPNGSYNFLFTSGSADTTGAKTQYGDNLTLWGPNKGASNGLPASSPDGGNFVGLDGAYNTGPLTQNITGLVIGQTYTLKFWWAAAQQSGFYGANTEQLKVSLGSDTQSTAVYNNSSEGFSGWMSQTFTYTASSTSEVLSFLAVGTPNGEPPFSLLDGVSLTDSTTPPTPTPLPAALFLVAPALAGVFGFSRGKQNKA